MQILKLGLAGAVIIGAVLGLLYATDVVPRDDLAEMGRMAFGGLFILVLAGVALRMVRGAGQPDSADKPVP